MNPHEIHDRYCRIVKEALEQSGYRCEEPKSAVKGVDIIAAPIDGGPALNVQVRGRLYFDEKDLNKNRHIAFPEWKASGVLVRLYSVDEMLQEAERLGKVPHARWKKPCVFYIKPTPAWALESPILRSLPYRLTPTPKE